MQSGTGFKTGLKFQTSLDTSKALLRVNTIPQISRHPSNLVTTRLAERFQIGDFETLNDQCISEYGEELVMTLCPI